MIHEEASSVTTAASVSYIGCGLYTAEDTAHILHLPTGNVKRWGDGYWYKLPESSGVRKPQCDWRQSLDVPEVPVCVPPRKRTSAEPRFSPGIVPPDLPPMGGRRIFSFHELIELRFVSWCRENGVSMPVIRAAAQVAAELFQATHPFALDTFATDGHNIFALMREKRADLALGKNVLAVELPKFQLVFTSMIEPYFKDLDFEDHWANRWWPLGKDRRVVLDPARRFGEPIDGETGVPTNSLYQTYLAEDKDMSRVAWWYDVPVEAVAYAVDYEKLLAS
jgi:DNA-binding transcriptional MerR regulator